MKLRNIEFGPIWIGSGGMGFFGEGYWFHKHYRRVFNGRFCPELLTFVAKTATLDLRRGKKFGEEGNMELADDCISPKKMFPHCIAVGPSGFIGGSLLNAVGLSNMGIRWLLQQKEWQRRQNPFFLSFMPIKEDEEGIQETKAFARILRAELPCFFKDVVGLQVNLSCPNAGVDMEKIPKKANVILDVLSDLNIPLAVKVNVLMPIEVAKEIAEHFACDALVCSNTIPYGAHRSINWRRHSSFLGNSPLVKYGGGGLSGKPLLPLVCEWVMEARSSGIAKPINVGGGILHPRDVDAVKRAGADGISIATALALRPWRVHAIYARAYEVFKGRRVYGY